VCASTVEPIVGGGQRLTDNTPAVHVTVLRRTVGYRHGRDCPALHDALQAIEALRLDSELCADVSARSAARDIRPSELVLGALGNYLKSI
jgi:hypothetical protein